MLTRALFIVFVASALAAGVARADCVPAWLGGEPYSAPEVWGEELGIARFDDGGGPQLYMAGTVSVYSEPNEPRFLIRWDGARWHGVASPLVTNAWDCAVYQGRLLVSGGFSMPGLGGQGIAAYDGITWTVFASTDGPVYELLAEGDSLTIGGGFSHVNGLSAAGVASWNGSTWSTFGAWQPGGVSALCRWNGQIVIASSSLITAWTGTTWLGLGIVSGGGVRALIEHDGRLFAGGDFLGIDGVAAAKVAAFDGVAWSPVGPSLTPLPAALTSVRTFAEYNGALVAAGAFASSGNASLSSIGLWDGQAWHAIGDGLCNFAGGVSKVAVIDGELVAAGALVRRLIEGGNIGFEVDAARWDVPAGTWRYFRSGFKRSSGDVVRTFAEGPGGLCIGGEFVLVGDSFSPGVAIWDGRRLTGLARPLPTTFDYLPQVYSVAWYDGSLFAGGLVELAGPPSTYGVARWDGQEWSLAGSDYSGLVCAMTVYDGALIAGGAPFAVESPNPATWDGQSWQPIAPGIANIPGTITAFIEFNGELIAATGQRLFARGITAVYRFDGASWERMGEVLPSVGWGVNALAIHNGELYAGGYFGGDPNDTYRSGVVRWDGVSWQPIQMNAFSSLVWSLASYGGELWVGGSFWGLNGAPHRAGLLRWNGTQWLLPAGDLPFDDDQTDQVVYALRAFEGRLCVGGRFSDDHRRDCAFAVVACPNACAADANCDGVVDFFDIDPFVLALAGESAYSAGYPDCRWWNADCDDNGAIDFFDIDPFVARLGTTCP